MINNPDIQPNATINRWIAGILLFDFTLRHVPGKEHASPDGLSRRPAAPEDPPDPDDQEDWIDQAYSFAVALLNDALPPLLRPALAPAISNVYMRRPRSSARPPIISPSVFTASLAESTVEIPRSTKARIRDAELLQIREFHESMSPAERNLTRERH